MEAIVITWRELLLLVVLVLSVYIAELLLMMRAGGALRRPRWLHMIEEKKFESELRQQLEALSRRVAVLETSMALKAALPTEPFTSSEFDRPTIPLAEKLISQTEGAPKPILAEKEAYQLAIMMAKEGIRAEVLVQECGISHSEADLIVSMQKP